VPQAAVQSAQGGNQVLVVGPDNKVTARIITLGQTDGSDYVVEKGLQAGDRVIVEGLQKAKPGQTVAPSEIKQDTGENTAPNNNGTQQPANTQTGTTQPNTSQPATTNSGQSGSTPGSAPASSGQTGNTQTGTTKGAGQ
jgi:membrane fusion protein (multidrug efflux system)